MGLGNALADVMLEGRVAGAESKAHWAGVRQRDAEDRFKRDMHQAEIELIKAKGEIAALRATVEQQRQALNKQGAQSLCAQAMVSGFVMLMFKSKDHPLLERVRAGIALEARKIMEAHDQRNSQNPEWVSLAETCKKLHLNDDLKVF
ncbi:hypothetical protein [Acidovorax sp. Root402]|uniref:hypothetical protein n=1 Tax=Acidovorax sp. Root402 TaxID=1736527 RepID=UPI000A9F2333|nr:hypothetical protein [Acidovorax sp. Root402]